MGLRTIKMPDVGEGVAEAEIVEWHVKVGDPVREDQPVAAVMTDKATVEIPTPVAGTVVALGGAVGDVLAVGSELIRIDAPGMPDSPPAPPPRGLARAATHATPEPARASPPPPPVVEVAIEPLPARVAPPSRAPSSSQLKPPPRGARPPGRRKAAGFARSSAQGARGRGRFALRPRLGAGRADHP